MKNGLGQPGEPGQRLLTAAEKTIECWVGMES
jgi:hypothetical protein